MEMQQKNTYNLPKRSRYYQAQIDVSLLEPGSINFNELNDLTTILVAPFDIFGFYEVICLERQWAREDGRAEGLEEGRAEGRA